MHIQCVSFIVSDLKWLLFPDQKDILYNWYRISLIMSGRLRCLARFLAYWNLTNLPAPTTLWKFNEEQRKFIVRIFAIQRSATQIRQEFLHHYGFKGVLSVAVLVSWPAHSFDLNPLDFHFWGEAQLQVIATRGYPGTHRVHEEVRCSLWKFNHQARRREWCEESQTVCRRKWWSFSTPYLIGSKTCHVIFIKDCYE